MQNSKPFQMLPSEMAAGAKLPTAAALLVWLADKVVLFSHRHRSRTALTRLSAHELSDIGLTREEAEAESLKRFWMP